jgi:galactose mutarotase-like enzyme
MSAFLLTQLVSGLNCATGKLMGLEHRVFEKDGHRLNEVTDRESGFRFVVDSLGAELVGITRDRDNADPIAYLYRSGEVLPSGKGWQSHATVMGYFLHRLWGEKSLYQGEEIVGGNHGFVRHKMFADPEITIGNRGTLTYSFPASQIGRTEYPRKVSFQISYALFGNNVEVGFAFQNEEPDRPAHLSFGLHPGFAVSSVENARIILPHGIYRRHLAPGNFLSGDTLEFESDGGTWGVKPSELPGSFLLEPVDVEQKVVILQDNGERRKVEIDLSEAPYLTIWSDLNPFVCIEPCWGLPDHKDQRPFDQKLGIQVIEPGGNLRRRFSMRFS